MTKPKSLEDRQEMGRPTVYKPEYAEQARKYCLLGATDNQLAGFFEVCEKTLNLWKKKHPDFLQSIMQGKNIADANVAERLYLRALGYEHPEEKIFNASGEPLIVPTTKHYPPDTQAASLWLRNRQPDKWRDTKNITVHKKKVKFQTTQEIIDERREVDEKIRRLQARL